MKLFFFLSFIFFLSFVSAAFGVDSACDDIDCYWEGRPLVLEPGESREVFFGLQNSYPGDVTLEVSLIEGFGIATLIDNEIQTIPSENMNIKTGVKIEIPQDAENKVYSITISVKEISTSNGTVELSTTIEKSFQVIVDDLNTGKDELIRTEVSEKREYFFIWIVGILILLILIVIFFLFKRIKKNQEFGKVN